MTPSSGATGAEESLRELREGGNKGLAETLGIELTVLTSERVVATRTFVLLVNAAVCAVIFQRRQRRPR